MIDEITRAALRRAIGNARRNDRLFQASCALLSNAYAGVDVREEGFQPRPVSKYEGGIMVRSSEVILFFYSNEGRVGAKATREPRESNDTAAAEKAAADLLTMVDWSMPLISLQEKIAAIMYEKTGMTREQFEDKIKRFVANPFSDPMRLLFSFDPY